MNEASIILDNVCVDYVINEPKRLSDYLSRSNAKPKKIRALSHINLQIKKGDRVGLIGLNGAGKSTLLRVMAQIYKPTQGSCCTVGRISPLFELATGFEMELDGWANIRIRAMLLGMPKKLVEEKMQEIAAFTELGHSLNYPVRTYSSGMFIRLAFAISTALRPEVLLLDEVIGSGDASFAQKAQKRMDSFIDEGHIIVLSTHAPDLIHRFCSRTLWLDKGTLRMDGPTAEVWKAYVDAC